ncbi:exported hypothetical protein [Flavobacterium sp. 9AF]|uniref:hypothetical protein n=1 Tax=Flavobacterium sp. 9AF TaxID=2653142 RepID=UPI0012F1ADD3|nr:hypothetical protein [Flavobacterium sp. 9AF]VXC39849.1 exported hypothetical protein [Flavobacterium sp. 9AF]
MKKIILLIFSILFASCSSEDTLMEDKKSNENEANRTLPPPIPGDLRGFYDVEFDSGFKANMLFEHGNYVSYGSATITDMLANPNMRTSYIQSGNVYEFTLIHGKDYINYRIVYDPNIAKFLGTYGKGTSYTNLGAFKGAKYFTQGTDINYLKGYWLGTYGIGSAPPTNDYVLLFEEDGKLSVAANATLYGFTVATGTYNVIGNSVIGTYTYLFGGTYSFKANLDYSSQFFMGTWGYGSSSSNGGNFQMFSWNFY